MKKILFVALWLIATFSYANEDCLFPPCPPPLTAAELKEANKIFNKTKYILGAAFDIQNTNTKNIAEFVSKTKKIKSDLKVLKNEAEKLNMQAGKVELTTTISTIELCISYSKSSDQYCHQALTMLKDYFWSKHFGTTWSGYPTGTEWDGFPKELK